MSLAGTLEALLDEGITMRLDADKVMLTFPNSEKRNLSVAQIAYLRAHRGEIRTLLFIKAKFLEMPAGIRLERCDLKHPPVAVEPGVLVTVIMHLTQISEFSRFCAWTSSDSTKYGAKLTPS